MITLETEEEVYAYKLMEHLTSEDISKIKNKINEKCKSMLENQLRKLYLFYLLAY